MKTPNDKSQQVSPPALNPIERQMTMMTLQLLQLERTIWLLVHEAGGGVVIDEASLNPLWDLKYDRVVTDGKPHPTLLRISANQMPEASDSQLRKLSELLAGQPEERTPSALMEVGLASYPPSYVVSRLAPLVRCENGKWTKV